MRKIKVGLVGYGYWGVNLLRNLVEHSDLLPVALCDRSPGRLKVASHLYPGIQLYEDSIEMLSDVELEALVIATHTSSHYEIAIEALMHNLHVFIEKPMVDNVPHAEELISMAKSKNKVLLVDHAYLYNRAVRKIREYIVDGSVGNINYIDSTRINLLL